MNTTQSGSETHTTVVKNDFDNKEYKICTTIVDSYYGAIWTTEVFVKSPEPPDKQVPLLVFDAVTDFDGSLLVQLSIGKFQTARKWPRIEPSAFELIVMAFVKAIKPEEWNTFFSHVMPPS